MIKHRPKKNPLNIKKSKKAKKKRQQNLNEFETL